METTIASLEEQLAAACREKEEAIYKSEDLALEIEALTKNLDLSSSEINALREELSGLVSFLCSPNYIPLVSQFCYHSLNLNVRMCIFV